MIRFKNSFLSCIIIFLFLVSIKSAQCDEVAVKGKEIAAKYENVVVVIKLVMKQKMVVKGKELYNSENKLEVNGAVIDSTGLVVTSLQQTEPSSFMNNMMHSMDEGKDFNSDSDLTSIKIKFSKDNEVDAKIVLRDKDLDLAFIQPVKKLQSSVASININDSAIPELLDRILILDRLGKVANETLSVVDDRIKAIVNKPRTFYVPNGWNQGSPVFSLENGKIIGIMVLKAPNIQSGGSVMSMFGGQNSDTFPLNIIIPASEIVEVSKQIPGEEKK